VRAGSDPLLATATAIAREISSKSPLAIQMLKQSFNTVENLTLRDGYRAEQDMAVELGQSEDAKEAKRAFLEKRKPIFTGR
jgi:enoyl-CoA hydratase